MKDSNRILRQPRSWGSLLQYHNMAKRESRHRSLHKKRGPRRRSLNKMIQDLPQELQDHVFDFVVRTMPAVVKINSAYRPPAQMGINQSTRKKFAKLYYEQTTFVFAEQTWGLAGGRHVSFWTWVMSLPREHALTIKRICIRVNGAPFPGTVRRCHRELLSIFGQTFFGHGPCLSDDEELYHCLRSALRVQWEANYADAYADEDWQTIDEVETWKVVKWYQVKDCERSETYYQT